MKGIVTVVVGLLVSGTALAQPPQDMLESRVNGLEGRIAAIEAKLGLTKTETKSHQSQKLTYAEALAKAQATGLPLVVWSGTAICPACVHETSEEFVSFVGDVSGLERDTITVGVADGNQMLKIAVINRWVTGDRQFGHVPSIRRALQRWRTNRQVTAPVASSAYQSTAFSGMGYGGGGMVMQSSGGTCATCQSSSGGLFRRR